MGIIMTEFEKNLERELKKLNYLENQAVKEILQKSKEDKEVNDEEIKKLEALFDAYQQGQKRIQKYIDDLKGSFGSNEPYSYNEHELREIIRQLVEKELGKNSQDEKEKKEKTNLVLENAMAKRKIMKKARIVSQKDKRIKDYEDLSRVGTVSSLKVSDQEEHKKITLLGNYWREKHQNLLFTPVAIEDVAKTFRKAEFDNLDLALNRLNIEEDLERKKIHPDSDDYYFSFRTVKGVKSRIFYRMMPEDFGSQRIVITQIIKQYHTRSLN